MLNSQSPIATISLPVNPGKLQQYEIVTVRRFKPFMKLVGGINVPKVITCEGSDGREYTQLVKGWTATKRGHPDDLRQDAVMQQVFLLINSLLKADSEAARRKLCIRTYKVSICLILSLHQ